MKTRQQILAPLLILSAILMATPALAKPLVGCDLTLDRSVLPAGQAGKAVIKVSLDVPLVPRETERPPVNLALVMDRSGSMSGEKIAKAREAAIAALHRLGPQGPFLAGHLRSQCSNPGSAAERRQHRVDRGPYPQHSQPGGNTALFGAVSQGAAEVRKNLYGSLYSSRYSPLRRAGQCRAKQCQ